MSSLQQNLSCGKDLDDSFQVDCAISYPEKHPGKKFARTLSMQDVLQNK